MIKLGKQYSEEGSLHIHKVLVDEIASICKPKNLRTNLTRDQTQNPLNESIKNSDAAMRKFSMKIEPYKHNFSSQFIFCICSYKQELISGNSMCCTHALPYVWRTVSSHKDMHSSRTIASKHNLLSWMECTYWTNRSQIFIHQLV
jgi:hypothetical protein